MPSASSKTTHEMQTGCHVGRSRAIPNTSRSKCSCIPVLGWQLGILALQVAVPSSLPPSFGLPIGCLVLHYFSVTTSSPHDFQFRVDPVLLASLLLALLLVLGQLLLLEVSLRQQGKTCGSLALALALALHFAFAGALAGLFRKGMVAPRHDGTETAQDRSHEPCIKQQVSNMSHALSKLRPSMCQAPSPP